VALSVDCPIEIPPLTLDSYVGFIHVPAGSDLARTPLAKGLAQEWSQFALPLPHRFMRKADPPLKKHFRYSDATKDSGVLRPPKCRTCAFTPDR
jgi:hypothetical protein